MAPNCQTNYTKYLIILIRKNDKDCTTARQFANYRVWSPYPNIVFVYIILVYPTHSREGRGDFATITTKSWFASSLNNWIRQQGDI